MNLLVSSIQTIGISKIQRFGLKTESPLYLIRGSLSFINAAMQRLVKADPMGITGCTILENNSVQGAFIPERAIYSFIQKEYGIDLKPTEFGLDQRITEFLAAHYSTKPQQTEMMIKACLYVVQAFLKDNKAVKLIVEP